MDEDNTELKIYCTQYEKDGEPVGGLIYARNIQEAETLIMHEDEVILGQLIYEEDLHLN